MNKLDHNKRYQFYFEQIAQIPHGSKNELALSNYLVEFAKEHQLEYVQDDMKNVIIWKTAQDCNITDYIMLQAHIDMVCEKNLDSNHDFENDPIKLIVEDKYVKADGTTLGADDGHGVAMMLAILEDKTSKMPPVECVFTVEEEIGLFGAIGLDGNLLRSKRMISLDGGGENFTLTSSAGGQRADLELVGTRSTINQTALKISVRGLQGGHSGGQIDKGLANSVVIMGRLLNEVISLNPQICHVEGGSKDNAIPRECDALILVDIEKACERLNRLIIDLKQEYALTEPNFEVFLDTQSVSEAFDVEYTQHLIQIMMLIPNGVHAMSVVFDGLVEASQNFGVIVTNDNSVKMTISMRSSIESQLDYMENVLKTISTIFGATLNLSSRYPGWAYVANSPLRDLFVETYESMYHIPVGMNGTHGGLEAGVFLGHVPGMDIITMGPKVEGIHTPEEIMDLESFDRTFDTLKELLSRMEN